MRIKALNMFLLTSIFIVVNSCDRPECNNTNPTFVKFTADSKEYKKELAKEMQSIGIENLSYWFEKYIKQGDKEFIEIHIQGKTLCAIGKIQVNDWSKISGMRKVTNGYRGAELKGLRIKIQNDSTETNFVYDNIETIID